MKHLSAEQILDLAANMEAKPGGFRVSAETAELVIEALRAYAREQAAYNWRSAFQVDVWSEDGESISERLAESGHLDVAKAFFEAAIKARPGRLVTTRRGARVVEKSDRPRR